MPMNYIDLFAGCGGLSLGLYNAGWHGLFAVEKNTDAFLTLESNLIKKKAHYAWPQWLEKSSLDIYEVIKKHSEQLRQMQGHVDLVVGGPPCQWQAVERPMMLEISCLWPTWNSFNLLSQIH